MENPRELIKTLKEVIKTYESAKQIRGRFPEKAQQLLKNNLTKLLVLQQIPKDKNPVSATNYDAWRSNLERITVSCQDMLDALLPPSSNVSLFDDWNWNTLQEKVHREILTEIFLPVLDEDAPVVFDTLILRGDRKVGKSFFLNRVRDYLLSHVSTEDHLFWSDWSDALLEDSATLEKYRWKVLLFDIDFFETPSHVGGDRYRILTERLENVITVVLTAEPVDGVGARFGYSWYEAELLPPSEASVVAFLTEILLSGSGADLIENIPLLQDAAELEAIAKKLSLEQLSYAEISLILHNAMHLTREYELLNGALWKHGDRFYTRNSVRPDHQPACQYFLLKDIKNDFIHFGEEKYVNVKFHDSAPQLANDAFSNVFIASSSSSKVICQLDIMVGWRSPLSLSDYIIADYVLKYWSTLARLHNKSLPYLQDITQNADAQHLFSHYSISRLRRETLSNLETGRIVVTMDCSPGKTFGARHGERTVEGVSCSGSAEDLRICLLENLGVRSVVGQVEVSSGIQSYYVHAEVERGRPVAFFGEGIVSCFSLVDARDFNDTELPSEYCITSENDLSVLQEKFPTAYGDMYRDERETWKMKPLRDALHLSTLNELYTDEEKFYATLYFALLRKSERELSYLSRKKQDHLHDLLVSVGNYVDFMFMIEEEEDDDRGDSETPLFKPRWTVCNNHRATKRGEELDSTVEVLKTRGPFYVSPEWFLLLHRFLDGGDSLHDIFNMWESHQGGKETSEMKSVFVRSSISISTATSTGTPSYKSAKHLLEKVDLGRITRSEPYLSNLCHRMTSSMYGEVMQNMDHISLDGKTWIPVPTIDTPVNISSSSTDVWKYVCAGLEMDPPLFQMAFSLMMESFKGRPIRGKGIVTNLFYQNRIYACRRGAGAGTKAGAEAGAGFLTSLNEPFRRVLHRYNHVLRLLKIPSVIPIAIPDGGLWLSPLEKTRRTTTALSLSFSSSSSSRSRKKNIVPRDAIRGIICRCVESYIVEDLIHIRRRMLMR